MRYKLYEVGGKVRDELLGLESNDVDYTVVVDPSEQTRDVGEVFRDLSDQLQKDGFKVFLETPEFFTIRARFPDDHKYEGVADFVLARREVGYKENTRHPIVVIGSLFDDLVRRDFTVNAMARGEDGGIIDYFNGQGDLEDRILKTPNAPEESFNDDPLRILRAIRFSVTRGFDYSDDLLNAIEYFDADRFSVISDERVRDELRKIFKFDTVLALSAFEELRMFNVELSKEIFNRDFWLDPTNKK